MLFDAFSRLNQIEFIDGIWFEQKDEKRKNFDRMCSSVHHHTHIITSQLFLHVVRCARATFILYTLYRCKTTRLLLNEICETNSWHLFLKLYKTTMWTPEQFSFQTLQHFFTDIAACRRYALLYAWNVFEQSKRDRESVWKKNPIRFSYDGYLILDIVNILIFWHANTYKYRWSIDGKTIDSRPFISTFFITLKKSTVDWINYDEWWIF